MLELVASKSVPGTMSVHGVVPVTPDHSIAVRDTYCFDACCWENCTSRRQCPGWKERVLFPGGDQVEEAEVEPAPEPEATEQSAEPAAPEPEAADRPVEPTPQEETYDVEDFLACIYDGQWYLGKVIERGRKVESTWWTLWSTSFAVIIPCSVGQSLRTYSLSQRRTYS